MDMELFSYMLIKHIIASRFKYDEEFSLVRSEQALFSSVLRHRIDARTWNCFSTSCSTAILQFWSIRGVIRSVS